MVEHALVKACCLCSYPHLFKIATSSSEICNIIWPGHTAIGTPGFACMDGYTQLSALTNVISVIHLKRMGNGHGELSRVCV